MLYALIQWYLAESSLWSSSIAVIQRNRWYCNILFQNLIHVVTCAKIVFFFNSVFLLVVIKFKNTYFYTISLLSFSASLRIIICHENNYVPILTAEKYYYEIALMITNKASLSEQDVINNYNLQKLLQSNLHIKTTFGRGQKWSL